MKMQDTKTDGTKSEKGVRQTGDFDRRDLMKLGVASAGLAIGVAPVLAAAASAQQTPTGTRPAQPEPGGRRQLGPPTGPLRPSTTRGVQQWPLIAGSQMIVASGQVGYTVHTGAGWKNDSGRAFGNGPMDETTRRITDFVDWYNESKLTPKLVETFNYLMADTLAVMYCAFETEPLRIIARLASTQRSDMKCTMLGYGVVTTPEMAAFGNSAAIRYTDFNTVPHNNETFGAILAIGEGLHASGPQVMAALTIAYEIIQACGQAGDQVGPGHVEWDNTTYHAVAVACAVGKLLGLNKDQTGNAVSLALTPHNALYSHIGIQTMWKGVHSSEMVRTGTWAALLAQAGMTGPAQPFEMRDGLFAHQGGFVRDLVFAGHDDDTMALETMHGNGGGYKRVSSEGNTQEFHQIIAPELLKWTKPEEIESMDLQVRSMYQWQEVCDPPKWDPQNKETADHSLPYNIARHLLDGYLYLDSFSRDKYQDPKARDLMNRTTVRPNVSEDNGPQTLTVKKKSGETRTFVGGTVAPMSHDDLIAKYNKAAEYGGINKDQAARALKTWMNLKDVKDIGDAIQVVAKFGNPRPLSDMNRAKYD
jgi:2-methylcitrate dehydratase